MRIGLGTAQFGLDYGITNLTGRPPEDEIETILAIAAHAGIDTLDTAPIYGSSEESLGCHGLVNAGFRIVTKTPKFDDVSTADHAAQKLLVSFERSLARLQTKQVHALLFHHPGDLIGPFGDRLWYTVEALKASGRVAKIGVSVYEGAEIDIALQRYPIDIVQLPWNPIDDRLIEGGQLARLTAARVEIHARSLFLQGLLLEDPARIPVKFAPIARATAQMQSTFANAGLSLLEGILALAFQQTGIHRFICGISSGAQLEEIVRAAEKFYDLKTRVDIAPPEKLDPRLLNPARWAELGA